MAFAQAQKFDGKTLEYVLKLADGHSSYRQLFGYSKETQTKKLVWMASCHESGQQLIRLMENLCFTQKFDPHQKNGIKSGKTIQEQLATAPLDELMEEITNQLKEEALKRSGKAEEPHQAATVDLTLDIHIDAPVVVDFGIPVDVEDPESKLAEWQDFVWRYFNAHNQLEVEPDHSMGLGEMLSAVDSIGLLRGDAGDKSYVGVNYDQKLAGQATTHPWLRVPPLREGGDHAKKLIKGVMIGCGDEDALPPGHLFFMWDAKRHGNEVALMKSFVDSEGKMIKKEKTTVYVNFTEKSLLERRDRVKGTGGIQTMEFLHVVSANASYLFGTEL